MIQTLIQLKTIQTGAVLTVQANAFAHVVDAKNSLQQLRDI